MSTRLLVIVVALCAWLAVGGCQEAEKRRDQTEIKLEKDGYSVLAVMRPYDAKRDKGLYFGMEGLIHNVCTDLQVVYRGEKVVQERTFFSDLADISDIEVLKADGHTVIRVNGGDAGGAYDCDLVMQGNTILKRLVRNYGSEEVLQEVNYRQE